MVITSSRFWKQTVSLTLTVALVGFFGFSLAEPATSTAQSTASTSFTASLTVDEEITINDGGNISMNPNINLSSDTSTGNTTLTVETNADEGYTLAVKAGSDPALQGSQDQFADYSPSTTNTPDAWSVDSSSKEFGYAAYGDDVSGFNNGDSCSDNDPANHNVHYEGFATTDEDIASNSGSTANDGNVTTLCVAAEQNGVEAEAGSYTANLTATATTN
jgi:hypothetical protein